MTYGELKNSVTEALGEDVLSMEQLIAGTRAGFGDMIHRGYREFKNIFAIVSDAPATLYEQLMRLSDLESSLVPRFNLYPQAMLTLDFPSDCLEILYVKIYFTEASIVPIKLALGNPLIMSANADGYYRTPIRSLDYDTTPDSIYYKKGTSVYVEWDQGKINGDPWAVEIGYYKTLPFVSEASLRRELNISAKDTLDITDVVLPMPDEYCNVLVSFLIWYVAQSNGYEQEQLTVMKNEYKYSMEDLLARKNKEDQYDESTTVIKIDGVM